jgi:superoxide dismutase, Cu-Zn family
MTERIIRINRFLERLGIYPQAARGSTPSKRPNLVARAAFFRGVLVAGLAAAGVVVTGTPAAAADSNLRVNLVTTDGVGAGIGIIRLSDAKEGLHLIPFLKSLAPGVHAIAFSAAGDCGPAEIGGHEIAAGASLATGDSDDATAAAPHVDLPPLIVGQDGMARRTVIAPGVKLEKLAGRALVIYVGAKPALGDVNAIVACGVIQ